MSTRIPKSPRIVRGAPQDLARWPGLPPLTDLAQRGLGAVVTDARTSWVRRLPPPANLFLKTYEYQSWVDRVRNFARWTRPFGRSRAAREFDALRWMRDRGLPAPEPVLVAEWRACGFLRLATLVTTAFPGGPAHELLPRLAPLPQRAVAEAIGRAVGRLHALGFFDGNLDLRNFVVDGSGADWIVGKIDSPRHRIVRGPLPGPLVARDWQRLAPQLEHFELDEVARAAARDA